MIQQCFLLLNIYFKLFFRFITPNVTAPTTESQKLSKLLNKARDSTLVTKKWNIVKDPLYANCAV